MDAARVLVVEDSPAIRESVESALVAAGHRVLALPDGAALESALAGFRPDLVILDVLLPGRDGFTLLDVVRRTVPVGVIVVTARDGVDDRLRGLRAGADDYVVKPFVLAELLARVAAVLRRSGRAVPVVEVADLLVDVESGVVTRAGTPVELTATELRLLAFLAARKDRVATKTQILGAVWGYEDYAANLVEVNISALRRKLEAHGPRLIHTIRGHGYTLRE
ncbi:response regulator transcription factor [Actinokineospora spheciospongiae]|uniref:response regulator transcription factor n=1 Tax=Actinokineospora spheciospongiae TaxID=909613 RepID=UPI000D71BF1C|nr:response regulator transcription factor [Actinokineospora spheciospongiae]